MDEIRTVRDAYGSPRPPTSGATASAFAQLNALIEAEGAAPAAEAPAQPRTRRRSVFGGWRMRLGAGLLAAGAAAAAVIAATGQDDGGPAHAGRGTTAQGVPLFLQVAAKADQLPNGRYWYTDQIHGQMYQLRPKTGAYAIFGAQDESFQYTGAEKQDGSAFLMRFLPARPVGPADEAAWRRAGSPTSFRVWSNDHHGTYGTKAGAWQDDPAMRSQGGRFLGLGGLGKSSWTPPELAALSPDAATLAKMLFPRQTRSVTTLGELPKDMTPEQWKKLGREGLGPDGRRDMTAREKLMSVGDTLVTMPLKPALRSAVMRVLSQQPGVHVVQDAADALGRRGVALVTEPQKVVRSSDGTGRQGAFYAREELIFSQATGELLAEQSVVTDPGDVYPGLKPGTVDSYIAVMSSGWTDTKPKAPAKAPF
ncbi:hypothetical protein [Actinomadura rupiterrae]|uniref:hypothetical protein n=1 Tax=Actinomadura rupiterrae TaxID=559627 RepID=UPI0020A45BCB|nr:hypothetical protein [Actinomadura rupiterrae]MCP2337761.1 hypothetical protein [Actinomadura rupiterrae]